MDLTKLIKYYEKRKSDILSEINHHSGGQPFSYIDNQILHQIMEEIFDKIINDLKQLNENSGPSDASECLT